MPRKALITGITGQDGSYLAEYLLSLGYEVHGLVRRVAIEAPAHRFSRLGAVLDRLTLHTADLESFPAIFQVLTRHPFDEVYHLAAQSFVAESFADGFSTMAVNVNGVHHMLAAIQQLQPKCRFFFAGTSEMFGRTQESPQREATPFNPRSPYGISKVAGYYLCRNYRESHGLHVASGIMFNHESPRRGFEFVTRKISSRVAEISMGLASELRLGNLDAVRDWGHARDYVRAMHMILQHPEPDDFVIATGIPHSVRDLCELAFSSVDLDFREFVVIDERFVRPAETFPLVGDATRARETLGWTPHTTFADTVREMVAADVAHLRLSHPREHHQALRKLPIRRSTSASISAFDKRVR